MGRGRDTRGLPSAGDHVRRPTSADAPAIPDTVPAVTHGRMLTDNAMCYASLNRYCSEPDVPDDSLSSRVSWYPGLAGCGGELPVAVPHTAHCTLRGLFMLAFHEKGPERGLLD